MTMRVITSNSNVEQLSVRYSNPKNGASEIKSETVERAVIPNRRSSDIKAIAADASVFSFGEDEDYESEQVGPFSGVGKGLMGMGSLGGSHVDLHSTQDSYVLSHVAYFFHIICHVMRLTGLLSWRFEGSFGPCPF
ncbi:hypothetical protein KY290_010226 [Solanum tuberosum]|uniref:Uncharacterized protein n=1 Tax=Solanum tuberosum TaxID=4113 RepID=A0ABQ7VX90_SOLTU|nr:hypothetical protein KY290_010226 [Solanum tuberosum]